MLATAPFDSEARGLLLAVAAMALDWLIGDPRWLWRGRLHHPVVLLGGLIALLERRLNRPERSNAARRRRGAATVLIAVGSAALIGGLIAWVAAEFRFGWIAELVLVVVLIAQRDLFDHVRRVGRALAQDGLAGGRAAVARIVGRDPESLDRHGVLRAAIESLAENFADGVIAPLFWYLLLGPIGICGYKAVNTLDSMIGHRSDRFLAFGMVAARLDDVANWIPARLGGALLAIAALFMPSARPFRALATMWRDAAKHRSPNAGWPEAAMAGALDLALAGPRRYHGTFIIDPWIGEGRARAEPADLRRALALFVLACVIAAALIVVALILSLQG
jgi:adenosylcobinamide-phosphate synthase